MQTTIKRLHRAGSNRRHLFRYIDGELTEAGCESYETSEDGLTWTFHLRDNKYSDGEEVKAQDYVNSIRRIFDPEVNCHNAGIFYCIAGGEAFNTGAGSKEDVGAVAVDDKTLEITLVEPIPYFAQLMTFSNVTPVPESKTEGEKNSSYGATAEELAQSGPFYVSEWTRGSKVVLKKNENYWGTEPNVDGIEFRITSDSNQAINAVQTGEVDIAMYLQGEAIKRAQDADLLLQAPSSAVTYVRFNMQNGPTANADVRKALTMAVDIDSMVAGIYQYGEGTRAYQPLPVYSFAYDTAYNDLVPSYDPEGAKKLLAEAGYPDGFTMSLYIGSTTYREKMAQMLQYYWSQIGVTLDIKSSTMADWSAAVVDSWQSDVVNSYGVSWNSDPDPYGFLGKFFSSQTLHASSNAGGYNDAELDELLNEGLDPQTTQSARSPIRKSLRRL